MEYEKWKHPKKYYEDLSGWTDKEILQKMGELNKRREQMIRDFDVERRSISTQISCLFGELQKRNAEKGIKITMIDEL